MSIMILNTQHHIINPTAKKMPDGTAGVDLFAPHIFHKECHVVSSLIS
jgi:hypothetical protein